MSLGQNRFNALLGEEPTEVDKLGNVKPVEKKNDQSPTRRDLRRTGQRQPAVSPPSRRGHRSNNKNGTENETFTTETSQEETTRPPREKPGRYEGRGRQFDRHSGTGIYDNEKKVNQGWGKAGDAEYQGARDPVDPRDPGAYEGRTPRIEEPDENTKTLDEYLSEKKEAASKFRLENTRQANEGSDDTQWKNTVVFKKEEDAYFVGSKK